MSEYGSTEYVESAASALEDEAARNNMGLCKDDRADLLRHLASERDALLDEATAAKRMYLEIRNRARIMAADIGVMHDALIKIASMEPHFAGQTPNEYHMQEIARSAMKETAHE